MTSDSSMPMILPRPPQLVDADDLAEASADGAGSHRAVVVEHPFRGFGELHAVSLEEGGEPQQGVSVHGGGECAGDVPLTLVECRAHGVHCPVLRLLVRKCAAVEGDTVHHQGYLPSLGAAYVGQERVDLLHPPGIVP